MNWSAGDWIVARIGGIRILKDISDCQSQHIICGGLDRS